VAIASPQPLSPGTGYMLNGTFFWERLISDEGVISIRVLSPVEFWSILVAAEVILFLLFFVLIGFIPVAILFWAYTRGRRNGVKKAAAAGTLAQLHYPRRVVKWDEVEHAKIKKGQLEVVTGKKKQKFEIPKASRENVLSFLSGKLGPKLDVVK
jgi:hypothetical protein